MKISEYMDKLEQILHEHGDLDIVEVNMEFSVMDQEPVYEYNMEPAPRLIDQRELPEDRKEEKLPIIYVEVS